MFGGGMEQKSVPLSDPAIAEIFGATPTLSGAVVNSITANYVPAVLQAVRLIAENVGTLPCKVYADDGDSKEAAKDHSAYRLVHIRASPWTSAGQLRVDLTADALLHGAGYAQIVRASDGRPLELHRLSPGTVQRRTEDDGEPYYLVNVKGRKQVRLSYRDVLYIPAFGGFAPVHAGKKAIGLAMVLERHAEQFFGGGARPSAVIWNENKLPDNERGTNAVANILADYRKTFDSTGPSRPLILTGGNRYQAITMNSTDAQFLENRVEQINEIARIFGVPPSMLYQLDRATWSNAEQMAASFLQLCLRPWLDRWQDAYATVLLTEDEQDDFYFEFVIDDLLRADAAGRTDNITKLIAARVIVPNEARAMLNLPAIEGGDELANPYTTTNAPAGNNDNAEPGEEAA
ncbi:MAG: phage portal protein [Mesorhizobium sp.]|nr:phage portal protein [Mesorhizobium sp.]